MNLGLLGVENIHCLRIQLFSQLTVVAHHRFGLVSHPTGHMSGSLSLTETHHFGGGAGLITQPSCSTPYLDFAFLGFLGN